MDYRDGKHEMNMGGICPQTPVEPLSVMLQEMHSVAADVLSMSNRINSHLFGMGNHVCEKETNPKCFRDELAAMGNELRAAAEELAKICSLLGV